MPPFALADLTMDLLVLEEETIGRNVKATGAEGERGAEKVVGNDQSADKVEESEKVQFIEETEREF